jgi:hypothetical protein
VAETIHALTEASKELFEAGQRLTDNLAELQQRIANAANWRNQVSDKPWIMAGLAVLAASSCGECSAAIRKTKATC